MFLNKKGQALIEFVLILPVLLLLLFGMIDLGRIIVRKSELESIMTDKITIWQNSNTNINTLKDSLEEDNIKVKVSKNSSTSFLTIEVYEKVDWLTPLVNNILDSYTIHVKRVVPNE